MGLCGRRLVRDAMAPLIPALGESLGLTIEKCYKRLTTDNIERLNQLLEENLKEEETEHKPKKEDKKMKKARKSS